MEQWNGLMRKEWIQWKWQLILAGGMVLIALLTLPPVVGTLTKDHEIVFEMTMVLSFMLMAVGIIIPLLTFTTMFNREMKLPDLWLHSTASSYKLICVKFLMAAFIGLGALLLPAVIVAIRFAMTEFREVTFDELAFFGTTAIIFFFCVSLMFMAIGFFFIVIDRLLKPFLSSFSIIATGLLFVLSARVYGEVTSSSFYERFFHAGKVNLLAMKNTNLQIGEGSSLFMDLDIYVGDILFDAVLTVILFFLAIKLFEKKVRI
ncbi:hypothetical protein QWT69_16470 [Sporosarcina oncorhynchi]|uniref:ABC transporter permease n=1 Tax=Sporosarcina oncorhynchi TaxID=3056444 RepID=A0ABZ0L5B9_9BACL|nr:hypothetical protein [Sporosarcina sp. T2O-4]WOV87422.1 hypothetical protein QWT69_16470 [Sporosarcina sp. T2O-4]